ncbi:hypothetical protein XU18_1630 [Perkinsela sp. CCAP 1560/4]|nr:hypothetical protein XU18_1630 [Perkinsela sp. CCAP 1560/4]|eukprot:KNH07739.1 hypothetical protein XU18_1630 [Perkinsela sp. CCAP 1560/4]
MIHYFLIVNKDGQTRLAHYTNHTPVNERSTLEGELVRKCLRRRECDSNFFEHGHSTIVYRRYASLYFIVGADDEENEMALLEFLHCVVETFEKYFENVCELDIMQNIERAHYIVQEMLMSGVIAETNKANILYPVGLLDESKRR